jgi:hypothetical protein
MKKTKIIKKNKNKNKNIINNEIDSKLPEIDSKLPEIDSKSQEIDSKLPEIDSKSQEIDSKSQEIVDVDVILYVTSFAEDMYNISGKILLDSFISNNVEGDLLVCYENFDFNPRIHSKDKTIYAVPLHTSKYLNTWLRKNKDIIPTFLGGICKDLGVINHEWNRKASRWFRKIAALEYALRTYKDKYKYIMWLDSDCKVLNKISYSFIEELFTNVGVIYHLGSNRIKNNMGVESSVIGFCYENDGYEFLYNIIMYYSTGEFRKLHRWDDGWAFRALIEQKKYKCKDLVTKPYKNFVIEYGAFKNLVTHNKGLHKRHNIML